MSLVLDGQGTTYTRSGLTLKPTKITFPGWEKSAKDVSTLSNSAYRTFILATLKTVNDMVLTLEYDPAVYGSLPSSNGQWTITWPGGAGSSVLWADIMSVGDVEVDVDAEEEMLVFDITLKITNRNGSAVETGPATS